MIFGTVIVLLGTWLLIHNEGRTINNSSIMDQVTANWVELNNPGIIDPDFDGKIIHATALLSTPETLVDTLFGIKGNVMVLKRAVQYRQVCEHTHNYTESDGTRVTEYSYSVDWVSQPVEDWAYYDGDYRGKNKPIMEIPPLALYAQDVYLGAYKLPREFIKQIDDDGKNTALEHVDIPHMDAPVLAELNRKAEESIGNRGEFVSLSDGYLYIGVDPANPQPGDVRMCYRVIPPETVSFMGKIEGEGLTSLHKGGRTWFELYVGEKPAEEILSTSSSDNTATGWGLRVCGFLLLLIGFRMFFKGVSLRTDPIRVVSDLLGNYPFLTGLLVSIGWAMASIGLGLLGFVPWVGLLFLLGGCGWLYGYYCLKTKKQQ